MKGAQTTLDKNESIAEIYPHEARLVEIATDDGLRWRFEAPLKQPMEFDNESRARLFADLFLAVDGFRINDGVGKRGIPARVALDGRPAIAAYIIAAWGSSPKHVSRFLDVEIETIYQYVSRVRNRAEEYIEEHG